MSPAPSSSSSPRKASCLQQRRAPHRKSEKKRGEQKRSGKKQDRSTSKMDGNENYGSMKCADESRQPSVPHTLSGQDPGQCTQGFQQEIGIQDDLFKKTMKDSGLSMQDIQQTIDIQDEFFTKEGFTYTGLLLSGLTESATYETQYANAQVPAHGSNRENEGATNKSLLKR
ncbi:hypothetical protein ACQ4PT_036018 [Festuca glaucescens]